MNYKFEAGQSHWGRRIFAFFIFLRFYDACPFHPLVQSSMHGHVNAEFSRNSFLGPFCPETDFQKLLPSCTSALPGFLCSRNMTPDLFPAYCNYMETCYIPLPSARSRRMCMNIINDETVASLPFLDLHAVTYIDRKGRRRQWDFVSRKSGQRGAVIIVPVLHPQEEVLLVRQFRVPLKSYTIEFPAGLIDDDESLEQTAERELYEETGYRGTIKKVLPLSASSAGLTNELVSLAFVDIDASLPENDRPLPHPEDTEDISVLRIPLKDLLAFLEEQSSQGLCIDSRLMMFAAMV